MGPLGCSKSWQVAFNVMMKASEEALLVERAEKWYALMLEAGCEPSAQTFGALESAAIQPVSGNSHPVSPMSLRFESI